jgi:hypothetical protein
MKPYRDPPRHALALIAGITPAIAQVPLTTKPNVSNLLSQCSANTSAVRNAAKEIAPSWVSG